MTISIAKRLLLVAYVMLLLGMTTGRTHATDVLPSPVEPARDTQVYGANGQRVGTVAPYGNNSSRFYDDKGRTLGTMTTIGEQTTFYDERGRVTGQLQIKKH